MRLIGLLSKKIVYIALNLVEPVPFETKLLTDHHVIAVFRV